MKKFILLMLFSLTANADCVELLKQIRSETYTKARSLESMYDNVKLSWTVSYLGDEMYYYVEKSNALAALNAQYDAECTNETFPDVVDPVPQEPVPIEPVPVAPVE